MCYKGKCFSIIPVENGCLALAILSAVATGLIFVASVIVGILVAADIMFPTSTLKDYEWGRRDRDLLPVLAESAASAAAPIVGVLVALVALGSLTAFIFSVLLCNGISKRRPGQVKAYFIYGVVTTILTVLASIFWLAVMSEPRPGIMGLVGCVVYSLLLVLVHQTYTKLSDAAVFRDHIRLVDGEALTVKGSKNILTP